MLITTFIIYGLLLFYITMAVCYKHKSFSNPISIFAVLYSLQTLIAPILFNLYSLGHMVKTESIVITIFYSALYFVCISIPFLYRIPKTLADTSHRVINLILPKSNELTSVSHIAILIQFIVFFTLLIISSGTSDWLTDPRKAYETSRSGSGYIWSLAQAMLVLNFIIFIYRKYRNIFVIFLYISLSTIPAYFLGSKSFILYLILVSVFYMKTRISKLPFSYIFVLAGFMITFLFIIQILQGTATEVAQTITYFEYFDNTSRFIQDFSTSFSHQYGLSFLSTFWQYIPRALYSEKPYVWGVLTINEFYNPGSASMGATPGILPWARAFLDFGVVGVIIEGLLAGSLSRLCYDYFIRRNSAISLIFLLQVGLFIESFVAPFYGAPFLLFLVFLWGEFSLLNLLSLCFRTSLKDKLKLSAQNL